MRRKTYPLTIIAVAAFVSAMAYQRLPASVPMHWDVRGNADGYASRLVGALLIPAIMLAVWGLMRFLPSIDPRRKNYDDMGGAYELVVNATLTLLFLTHVVIIAAMLGFAVSIARVIPVLIGALFVVIGWVLPRAKPNWFFGIRTPWTLSNDRVWERTHRVGGHLFLACGLLMVASAALPPGIGFPVVFTGSLIAAVGSMIFSYIAWKQETSK